MNDTKDATILKVGSMIAGLAIVETSLILGVDGAAMLMGGTLLGLSVGAAAPAAATKLKK